MNKFTVILFLTIYTVSSNSVIAQIQVGDVAPDFTVTDVEGHTHTLSAYLSNGQYVMLDFFYTTCGPCQYYTPQLSMAYENYGCNQGDIVVLGIDYNDTDEEVLQYEQTYGSIYPSASGIEGGGNAVVAAYGVTGFPFVILIAPDSIVVEHFQTPTLQVFNYYFPLYGIEEIECITGKKETNIEQSVLFYPNPVSSLLNIEAATGTMISMYNSSGQQVAYFIMGSNTYQYNVTGLLKGLYMVSAVKDDRITTYKICVTE